MNTLRKMNELPPSERPYEKCLQNGPGSLSDAELLAVILRTGTKGIGATDLANQVLTLSKGNEGLLGLHHLSLTELMKLQGIGQVKAIQLKCIGELSIRLSKLLAKNMLSFQSPRSIADYYMESMRHEEQEQLLCLLLDTKNHLLGEEIISKGTVNASLISPREIFLTAFRYHAVNIILIHNHPSGDAKPSPEDISITKRIWETGELLGIHLLDHIVIGDHQYVSLCEQDLL